VRAMSVGRFPFAVYFLVEHDVISIIAVAHQSREPYYWRNRL
jgi:hypothetical protein